MESFFTGIADFVGGIIDSVCGFGFSVLPDSPFQLFIVALGSQEWLSALNWLVPISSFVAIGTAWVTCIGVYYIYSAILRWIKAID